jgi:restriction endonuclease Mrr
VSLKGTEGDFGIITSGEISPELEKRVREIYEQAGVRIQFVDGEQLAAWLVERG